MRRVKLRNSEVMVPIRSVNETILFKFSRATVA